MFCVSEIAELPLFFIPGSVDLKKPPALQSIFYPHMEKIQIPEKAVHAQQTGFPFSEVDFLSPEGSLLRRK